MHHHFWLTIVSSVIIFGALSILGTLAYFDCYPPHEAQLLQSPAPMLNSNPNSLLQSFEPGRYFKKTEESNVVPQIMEKLLKFEVCDGELKGKEHKKFLTELKRAVSKEKYEFSLPNRSSKFIETIPQLGSLKCLTESDFNGFKIFYDSAIDISDKEFNHRKITKELVENDRMRNKLIFKFNAFFNGTIDLKFKEQAQIAFKRFGKMLRVSCKKMKKKCFVLLNNQLALRGSPKLIL